MAPIISAIGGSRDFRDANSTASEHDDTTRTGIASIVPIGADVDPAIIDDDFCGSSAFRPRAM
jgi:hypothetical protein